MRCFYQRNILAVFFFLHLLVTARRSNSASGHTGTVIQREPHFRLAQKVSKESVLFMQRREVIELTLRQRKIT